MTCLSTHRRSTLVAGLHPCRGSRRATSRSSAAASCTFAEKGTNAQAAGAAALIIVNNGPSGTLFPGGVDTLSIPVFIFDQTYGPALIAADGQTHTITDVFLPSQFKQLPTAFTSGGPRDLDNALKPEVSAPGANVVSAAVGTGNEGKPLSGTSMAAPHTTGTAALVIQAHPHLEPGAGQGRHHRYGQRLGLRPGWSRQLGHPALRVRCRRRRACGQHAGLRDDGGRRGHALVRL